MNEIEQAIRYIDGFYNELLKKFTYTVNDDGTYTVTGLSAEFGKDEKDFEKLIVPPNTTKIAVQAFESRAISEVLLPEGLVELGKSAFWNCHSLKKIVLPSTLKKIDARAFCLCNSLEEISLPEGLEYIGDSAFDSCYSLEKVVIPSSVAYIGKRAFQISSLRYVLTDLKEKPAGWDEDFIDRFHLKIGDLQMVWGTTQVPERNRSYEPIICNELEQFQYKKLKDGTIAVTGIWVSVDKPDPNVIIIPENTSVIGYRAFASDKTIRKVVLPDGLKKLEPWAFSHCSNLSEINIPESLNIIDNGIFSACLSLEEITIPKGITFVYSNALEHCTALKVINIGNPEVFNHLKKNLKYCKAEIRLMKE